MSGCRPVARNAARQQLVPSVLLLVALALLIGLGSVWLARAQATQGQSSGGSANQPAQVDESNRAATPTPLDIRYVGVSPEAWPPAEAADMREVPAAQWNAWIKELQTPALPPAALEEWTWEARLDVPSATLQGEFTLGVSRRGASTEPHLLPLGEMSAAIIASQAAPGASHAWWKAAAGEPSDLATVGNLPGGELAMIVDRTGEAAFQAIQKAREQSTTELRWSLDLPVAVRRTLLLTLPAEWKPRTQSGSALVEEVVTAGNALERQWRIRLSGSGSVMLIIGRAPAPDLRATQPPAVRETTEYRADPDELLVRTTWEVDLSAAPPAALQLQIPPELTLLGITAESGPIDFTLRDEIDPRPRRVAEFPLAAGWASRTIRLVATARMPLPAKTLTRLPRMQLANVFWETSRAQVRVMPPLRLADFRTTDARQTTPLSRGSLEAVYLSPTGSLEINVERWANAAGGVRYTRLALQGSELHATCFITARTFNARDLTVADGRLLLPVTPEWQVRAVRVVSAADTVSEPDWSLIPATSGAGPQLSISTPAEGWSNQDVLQVAAIRNATDVLELPLAQLLPLAAGAEFERDLFSVAHPDGANGWQLPPLVTAREPLPSALVNSQILSTDRGPAILELDTAALNALVRWRSPASIPRVMINVAAAVDAPSAQDSATRELHQEIEFSGLPAMAPAAGELVLAITGPRDNGWTWIDADGNALAVVRLSDAEAAQRKLSASASYWTLPAGAVSASAVIARRTHRVDALPTEFALAAVVGLRDQFARIQLVTAGNEILDVPQPPAGLQPLWPEADDLEQRGHVARYAYDPLGVLQAKMPATLTVAVRSVSNSAGQGFIRRGVLDWRLARTGTSRCRVSLMLEPQTATEFTFGLPPQAQLIEVSLNGQPRATRAFPQPSAEAGGQYAVDVVPRRPQSLELEYTLPGTPPGLTEQRTVPWPDFQVPVLEQQARLHVPPDLSVAHTSLAGSASPAADILGRLLGLAVAPRQALPNVRRGELSAAGAALGDRVLQAANIELDGRVSAMSTETANTWRVYLLAMEDDLKSSGVTLAVDFPALAAAGVQPQTPLSAARFGSVQATQLAEREHALRLFQSSDLVLVILDESTVGLTTAAALLEARVAVVGSLGGPVFELAPEATAVNAWRLQFVRPLDWRSVTPVEFTDLGSRTDAILADHADVYVLPADDSAVHLIQIQQQAAVNVLLLAIAAVCGWMLRQRRSRFAWMFILALAAVSVQVPPEYARLVAGAPAACLAGMLLAWMNARRATIQQTVHGTVRRYFPRSRTSTVTLSVVLLCAGGLVLSWSGARSGAAERQPGTSRPDEYVVYVALDEAGQPHGGSIFAADELIEQVRQRLHAQRMTPRGALFTSVAYRLRRAAGSLLAPGAMQLRMSLRVTTFEEVTPLMLPLAAGEYQLLPETAFSLPVGRDISLNWGRSTADLTLQGVGDHVIDVELQPREIAGLGRLQVSIPQVAESSLELVQSGSDNALARRIRVTGQEPRVREFPQAGISLVDLGPVNRLQLGLGESLVSSTDQIQAEARSWLRITPQGAALSTRIVASATTANSQELAVQAPPGWRLASAMLDGRQVESPAETAPRTNAPDQRSIGQNPPPVQIVFAGGQSHVINLEFIGPQRGAYGQWRFPELEFARTRLISHQWGISADAGLQLENVARERLGSVEETEFANDWGREQTLWEAVSPLGTGAHWTVTARPAEFAATSALETELLVTRSGIQVDARMLAAVTTGQQLTWHATLPSAFRVASISVLDESDREILEHWSRTDAGLTIFAAEAANGLVQIDIRGQLPLTELPTALRAPLIRPLGSTEVRHTLSVFQGEGTRVTIAEPIPQLTVPTTPVSQFDQRAEFVGAFPLAPGGEVPRLTIDTITAQLRGALITRLFRAEGRWQCSVSFRGTVAAGELAEIPLWAPADWKLVSAGRLRTNETRGGNEAGAGRVIRLRDETSWSAQRAGGECQFRVEFELPETAGDFDLAATELPRLSAGQLAGNQWLVVPRQVAVVPLIWEGSGWEPVAEAAEAPTAPGEELFRARTGRSVATIAARRPASPTGALAPHISLVAALVPSGARSVTATYFVWPRGANSLTFELPASARLVDVNVAGLAVSVPHVMDGACRVPLQSSSAPQTVTLTLLAVQGQESETIRSVTLPRARKSEIGEVLWFTPEQFARDASASQLTSADVSRLWLTQLATELSNQSPAPLALELAAAAARRNVSWGKAWSSAPQVGMNATNEAAGALQTLAESIDACKRQADAALGPEWRIAGTRETSAGNPAAALFLPKADNAVRVEHDGDADGLELRWRLPRAQTSAWERGLLSLTLALAAVVIWPLSSSSAGSRWQQLRQGWVGPVLLALCGVAAAGALGAWWLAILCWVGTAIWLGVSFSRRDRTTRGQVSA